MGKQSFTNNRQARKTTRLWLVLFLLLLCLPLTSIGETVSNFVTNISVSNRPVKGIIQIEKTGIVQTGINGDGSIVSKEGPLKNAVFEIHAAEDIVGKDSKQWYRKGELVATVTTGDDGMAQSPLLPLGAYDVSEVTAPDGYILSNTHSIVTLTAVDQNTPVITATVSFTNDPNEIMLIKTDTSGKPMQGISFGLLDAEGKPTALGMTDGNGLVQFKLIPCGTYTIRELGTPTGYCTMKDITVTVESSVSPKPILCVNIPNHYAFQKTDSSGVGLAGVRFVLEDRDGNVLRKLKSDKDGMVSITDLKPGVYYLRETETLDGYTLSGDVRKITIDEKYIVPEELPKWVNYTTIQTGVQITVTSMMWVGIGLMILGAVMGIFKRRQKKKGDG